LRDPLHLFIRRETREVNIYSTITMTGVRMKIIGDESEDKWM